MLTETLLLFLAFDSFFLCTTLRWKSRRDVHVRAVCNYLALSGSRNKVTEKVSRKDSGIIKGLVVQLLTLYLISSHKAMK